MAASDSADHHPHLADLVALGQLTLDFAHEVKNAVAAVSGALEVLHDLVAPGEPEAIFTALQERLRALDRTTSDMQMLGRPAQPDLRPVSIHRVLDEAASQLREEAAQLEPDVTIAVQVVGGDVVLQADAPLLIRLFHALYSCVVPMSRPRGRFEVRVGRRASLCRVAFQHALSARDSKSRLRLSMAQRIAEWHGGRVAWDDSPAGAPRCTVELPLQPTEATRSRR